MKGEIIARLIIQKRYTEDLSLEQAADQSGLNKSTLHCLEHQKHAPDIDTLTKISAWLGIPLDMLMKDDFPMLINMEQSTMQKIDSALFADMTLTMQEVNLLSRMMWSAYDCVVSGKVRKAEEAEKEANENRYKN